MSKTILQNAIAFFLANAGFSYDPKTETQAQGKKRCAEALAVAERDGASQGLTFEWTEDDGEFSDDSRKVQLWICICRHAVGDPLATLGGIDLGEELPPQTAYCRVIQAELALQALAERASITRRYLAKDDKEPRLHRQYRQCPIDPDATPQEAAEELRAQFEALPLQEQLEVTITELEQDKTTREELAQYIKAVRAAFGWLPDDKQKALIEELRRTR